MFDSANQRKYLWRVEFTEEKELGKPKKLHSQFTHLEPWNQLNINISDPISRPFVQNQEINCSLICFATGSPFEGGSFGREQESEELILTFLLQSVLSNLKVLVPVSEDRRRCLERAGQSQVISLSALSVGDRDLAGAPDSVSLGSSRWREIIKDVALCLKKKTLLNWAF